MMQPINLLPPYIFDKQKKFAMVGLWAAVVAVIVLGSVFFMLNLNQKLDAAKAERDKAQQFSDQWNKLDGDIKGVQASVKTIKDQMDFVSSAKTYNDAWPAAYETLREYSSSEILLMSASIDPVTRKIMTVGGFAQNDRKIVKWWQQLVNHAEYESVNIGLPSYGYTPGGGTASNGGFGGMGGFGRRGGMGMGMPGGMSMMPPGMSGGMPGMPSGGPSAMGISRTSAPGMSGGPGMGMGGPAGMMGGRGGFGGGNAAGGGSGAETEIEGRRGILFTATLILKEPLAGGIPTPSWPPGAAAATGGGFGGARMGGMPGMPMMGGMSGMPPGMSGPPPGMGGPTAGRKE